MPKDGLLRAEPGEWVWSSVLPRPLEVKSFAFAQAQAETGQLRFVEGGRGFFAEGGWRRRKVWGPDSR